MADVREHGATVLSGILPARKDLLDKALLRLNPDHFEDKVQSNLFKIMERYADKTGSVLPLKHLGDTLRSKFAPGQVELYEETYTLYAQTEVTDAEFIWSVDQLKEIAAEKATGEVITTAMEILRNGREDESGEVHKGHAEARNHLLNGLMTIDREVVQQESPEGSMRDETADILADYAERKQAHLDGSSLGIQTGITSVDAKIGGMQNGELWLFAGYSSDGKAVAVSQPIVTPDGLRLMGDLQVGDLVCNTYGGASVVQGVYPQGVRKIYRLEFSDGTSAEATEDHLWTVKRRMPQWIRQSDGTRKKVNQEVDRTYTTSELMPMMKWKNSRPYLPDIAPVNLRGTLPENFIDPYLLGLLLGDGCLVDSTVTFTSPDPELAESIRERLPVGFVVSNYTPRNGATTYSINGREGDGTHFRAALVRSGVSLVKSPEKRIPERYLWASSEVRLAVLQGLMDTDGWVEKGTGKFSSASRGLRDDVVFLARSLGLWASTRTKEITKYSYKGEDKYGLPAYTASISYHPELFRLSRQRDLLTVNVRKSRRVIDSISYVRDEEAQCISVDSRDHLYLLPDFIPTHNTSLAIQSAWSAAVEQGKNVLFLTTETLRPQIRRKLIARHSVLEMFGITDGLNTRDLKSGTLTAADEGKLVEVVGDLTTNPAYGEVYIAQVPRSSTISSIEQRMYRVQRKMHIDLVIMDYLALLASDRKRQTSREELAAIMKEAKQVSTTFDGGRGVPFASPWQVTRAARENAEKLGMYTSASLSETAEATNSADGIISLLAPTDNTDRRTEVTMQLLKNRDGETANGLVVSVDYATSCFSSRVGLQFANSPTAPSTSSTGGFGLDSLLD